MKIFELQASQIDRQLRQTAQGIGNQPMAGAEPPGGGMEQGQQPQNQPEPPPDVTSDEDDDKDALKKVDSFIMARVRNMSYVTDYEHREDRKTNPYRILQMRLDELRQLRNVVRTQIGKHTFSDQFGLYDRPDMQYYRDLMAFTERVITLKRDQTKAKSQKDGYSPTVPVYKGKTSNLTYSPYTKKTLH